MLTLTLTAVALSLLGALVVVATVSKADSLSTVALVLAVLAFGAQLIVTAAQSASANEQYRQVTRLYEDTRGVLQRIRAQSKMLLANQSEQFNKILDHVLSPSAIESAVAEARGTADDDESPSPESTSTADASEIAKLLRAEAERALDRDRPARDRGLNASTDRRELRRFPREEEGKEVAVRFGKLSEEAKDYLRAVAERATKSPDIPLHIGQLLNGDIASQPAFMHELAKAGFVELEPYRRQGVTRTGRKLTDDALVAVRFFTGHGVVPDYLRSLFDSESKRAGS